MENAHFDVVVVGAGAAGCVLANRLTDADRSVLLIEAGPDYGPGPSSWPVDLRDPDDVPADSHPWGYLDAGRTQDEPLPLPRARVVGGSTTINACTWLRGSAADYDGWAAQGNPGWSFDDLLPFFRRAEADPLGGSLHGTNGPIPVFRASIDELSPVDLAFASAGDRHGFPSVADLNGAAEQSPGIGPRPQNVTNGVRMNAAFTYLAAARARTNFTLLPNTLVDRVLLENGRATGVLSSDGRVHRADEIVLAAGAYGSPAILLRSGIGPAGHLAELAIPVVSELPGVGAHLLDHPLVIDGLGQYLVRPGYEPETTTTPFLPLMIMARSARARQEIDLGILLGQAYDAERGSWGSFPMVSLLGSRSEGRVRLTSADPEAPLDIRHSHLDEEADLEAISDGVDLVTELLSRGPMAEALELLPDGKPGWSSRAELQAWLRRHVGTMFHPSGTCQMGPDANALGVVDHVGRVRGLSNLRVADASIFPTIPRATIHFAVVAAAEKLADALALATVERQSPRSVCGRAYPANGSRATR